MSRHPVLPYVWMLLGSVAFAVMGAMAHALGSCCDWQVIALARSLLPMLLAAGLARQAGARLVFWRPGVLWIRSTAGSISMMCTFFALTRLPVSDVFTLTNMFPIWVVLFSWFLHGESPPGHIWLSVASGVTGVVLIEQPHLAAGNFAAIVALVSSIFTAIAMLGLNRLKGIDPRAIVVHFSGVALLFCVGCFFLFDRSTPLENLLGIRPLVLLVALGATATVGQLFLTRAFTAGLPTQVSVVGLTQIVFAMGFDILLWNRSFDGSKLLGIILVVVPTAWLMLSSRPVVVDPDAEKVA